VPDFLQSWGRLLRVSLAPTAVADILCGSAISGATRDSAPLVGLLVVASLCVYHGGMALNDWADRDRDAKVRRERPIPAGAISARAALFTALAGLLLGPLVAATVSLSAGLWALGIASLAATYDLVGRGPWNGPLLLGLCRAGNLSLPAMALGVDPSLAVLAACAPALYGLYVFTLSRLGRLEDGEAGPLGDGVPGSWLLLLAGLLLLVPLVPVTNASWVGRLVAGLLVLAAAPGLLKAARRDEPWTPTAVMEAMGSALRRMLVFTAALTCLANTPFAFASAGIIMLLYPAAWLLRGAFPPS
jgi:4-hydroxybenzoate polyprenyltransferase